MLSSLCRLVLVTSSAFLSPINVTIEFATPASTPQSLLFCLNDTSFSTLGVQITSLLSSGTLNSSAVNIMAGYQPISVNSTAQVPSFFEPNPFLVQLSPLEAPIGLSDVLGTDPYYSTSYSNLRYDDFQVDNFGNDIRGIPAFPNITSFARNLPVAPPVNCFLLSGNWTPLTKYQMTFTISNSQTTTPPLPALWFASLQAATIQGQSYGSPPYQSSDIAFNLLGNKYGSVCPANSQQVTVPSPLSISESLCLQYTTLHDSWVNRTLSDNVVYELFLQAFTKQASGFIDANDVIAANRTLYSNYMLDERYPSSPTRQISGLKPNCNKCKDGTFTSVTNQKTITDVYDYRFGAMNVFRVIGYVLYTSLGKFCPSLWDPANPLAWTYGPYSNVLCQPIPSV